MKNILIIISLVVGFVSAQAANVNKNSEKTTLTVEEQNTVEEAKKVFAEAKKSKQKPSKNMSAKMNSTFGTEEKKK